MINRFFLTMGSIAIFGMALVWCLNLYQGEFKPRNLDTSMRIQNFVLNRVQMPPSPTDFKFQMRSIVRAGSAPTYRIQSENWAPESTAVILCDVWDFHHSINAVRRMDEFLPRLDRFVETSRQCGATIIHAPSDCMDSYAMHPSRSRAVAALRKDAPAESVDWCCSISQESNHLYPLDQSDGGEDDDAEEHRQWREELTRLGRNPAMPWKSQNKQIRIDESCDFISDRGDEVWSILKNRQIKNVVLVGVHTNMCVLGRPFGLRQMVRQGFNTVLVRDLTDCMYNPKQWPYVDHFTGNELLVSYIEEHVCPTITSDQILGGNPFRFQNAPNAMTDIESLLSAVESDSRRPWRLIRWTERGVPKITDTSDSKNTLRCSLSLSPDALECPLFVQSLTAFAGIWLNGNPLDHTVDDSLHRYRIDKNQTFGNRDSNTLVIVTATPMSSIDVPSIVSIRQDMKEQVVSLTGTWEWKSGANAGDHTIPLPAKFGLSPEVFHSVE